MIFIIPNLIIILIIPDLPKIILSLTNNTTNNITNNIINSIAYFFPAQNGPEILQGRYLDV